MLRVAESSGVPASKSAAYLRSQELRKKNWSLERVQVLFKLVFVRKPVPSQHSQLRPRGSAT